MKTKELELYIHIPFCIKKCNYCDFLSFPSGEDRIKEYIVALKKEIIQWNSKARGYTVTSIFFGGGTPSMIDGQYIVEIMDVIRENYCLWKEYECSIEVNPGTVDEVKLRLYQQAGINRISFGLQSGDDEELKILGRIHTYDEFLESYKQAREVGFSNINVDLMSAIPTQTIDSYQETLHKVCKLNPEHISAYSLILEEGTLFYDNEEIEHMLPSEDEDVAMYEMTQEVLDSYGYHRYEISNYAKENYECNHNIGYWERTPYLGFGLGASSFFEEKRFTNLSDIKEYCDSDYMQPYYHVETLTKKEQMEEYMFLGLRMMKGVSFNDFYEAFHEQLEDIYGVQIEKLIKEELLIKKKGRLMLTTKGHFLNNQVVSEFI